MIFIIFVIGTIGCLLGTVDVKGISPGTAGIRIEFLADSTLPSNVRAACAFPKQS